MAGKEIPPNNLKLKLFIVIYIVTIVALVAATIYYLNSSQTLSKQVTSLSAQERGLKQKLDETGKALQERQRELTGLKNQDQYLINKNLEEEIKNIQSTYVGTATAYDELLSVQELTKKTEKLEKQFAQILTLLSKRNYSSASAQLASLKSEIAKTKEEVSSTFKIPETVAAKNTAPGSGYSRQRVDADIGSYLVDIVAADLGSTRVIVDTASDGDCRDNCPVLPLGDYAARSGAFAAINGPYFCPASYGACAGKTNSFDTLMMNKKKTYFNSDNNVYSNVPAVIFSGSSGRFVGASSEWGRDTGPDSVIASQPMLLSGGSVVFGGDGEVKRAGKGSRSFIGTKGSTVYIGVVHNASVAEVARVLKTLGLEYALNLDSGGSTALMSGGRYVVGPGRALPFGILLMRK